MSNMVAWIYRGCKVEPAILEKPQLVGYLYMRKCWRVTTTDGKGVLVQNKAAARSFIDKVLGGAGG